MQNVLLVAAGGAIGASLRHGANMLGPRLWGLGFPWATVAVNLVGCFAMGLFVEWLARVAGGSTALRLFVTTGVLGGFTTFSAFSLDFATLFERGALGPAFAYLLLSVVGSLAGVFAGLAVGRIVF